MPANGIRLDDLIVVAPNPLAHQLLQDQLKVQRRLPRGLNQRCSEQLLQQEAVHWNPAALAQMFGPIAPLAMGLAAGLPEPAQRRLRPALAGRSRCQL